MTPPTLNRILFVLFSLAISEPLAFAQVPQPLEAPAPDPEQTVAQEIHSDLSQGFASVVEDIDQFFGENRLDEEANHSRLRIRGGAEFLDIDGWRFRQRVNLQVDLPRTEKRTQLVLSNTFDGEQGDVPFIDQNRNEDNSFTSALRYFAIEEGEKRLSADAGLRWHSGVAPFVQLRARYRTELYNWIFTPVQLVFYRHNDDGLGETTRYYLDRILSNHSLFRIKGEATYAEETDGIEFNQGISYLCNRSEVSGFSVELFGFGETEHGTHMTSYEATGTYRHLLYSNWFYAQGGPLLKFEDDHEWKANPGALFELEVVFGDLTRPLMF